ncbi:MAG: dienelactone hydrolase family protein [Xanthomonadales bacterium]|nr:dienelactone hydrolase family protein [Xanthomonadales bacterium]
MLRRCMGLFGILLWATTAQAAVQDRAVSWELDGTRFQGHILHPDSKTPLPGLLMVPNWMGVNASALEKARKLAEGGYVVLLADVYGEGVRPKDTAEAAAAAHEAYSDLVRLRARAQAALDRLLADEAVPLDRERLAAVGFCFGGGTVLELGRAGADLDAIVTFHGALDTNLPAAPGAVKASLLVLNGADDSYVSAEHIAAFQGEMTAAGADWQFVNLAGAVHCFAEADAHAPPGCVYHERSARRAYRMMSAHLAEAFAAP